MQERHLEAATPYRGVSEIPEVKAGCTVAPITFPLVTSAIEELQHLLLAWMSCHLICPIKGCNGRTPGPHGRAEGVPLQAKATRKLLDPEGKLPKGMPRFDDFLVHFFAVHRAQGYTVFHPCPVCPVVFGKFGSLGTHVKNVHHDVQTHAAKSSAQAERRTQRTEFACGARPVIKGMDLSAYYPDWKFDVDTGDLKFPRLGAFTVREGKSLTVSGVTTAPATTEALLSDVEDVEQSDSAPATADSPPATPRKGKSKGKGTPANSHGKATKAEYVEHLALTKATVGARKVTDSEGFTDSGTTGGQTASATVYDAKHEAAAKMRVKYPESCRIKSPKPKPESAYMLHGNSGKGTGGRPGPSTRGGGTTTRGNDRGGHS